MFKTAADVSRAFWRGFFVGTIFGVAATRAADAYYFDPKQEAADLAVLNKVLGPEETKSLLLSIEAAKKELKAKK